MKLHPALENVEQIRILVGLQTDRTACELLQRAKEQGELTLKSHATTKEQVARDVLTELEKSPDTADLETGVHKFIEWVRSGKLEIKAHPPENLHSKVYIITFDEGDRDNRSPHAQFTPLELYLKFLYEDFKDKLNRPDESCRANRR